MSVKRYTLINGLLRLSWPPTAIEEGAETHARFTGEKQVVLASDYDALAAELAGYKASHEQYCPSAARVRELEQALHTQAATNVDLDNRLLQSAARVRELEAALRKCRSALTAGRSENEAARNAHYWQPVIKTIDAALAPKDPA